MVVKQIRIAVQQIRIAVQRELTYIQDQCSVHRLVLGHLHGNFQVNCTYNKIAWSVYY